MHLALDLVFEDLLPLGEHLLDVRPELARVGVDDLKLLFDAEREGGGHELQFILRHPRAQDKLATLIDDGLVPVSSNGRSDSTISISASVMLLTTHSKFSSPTELRSASGAQFMKSMA